MNLLKLCFLILIFCFKITGYSQDYIGFKTGASFATIKDFPNFENSDNTKFGINFGLFSNLILSKKISFRPEIIFNRKGSSFKSSNGNGEVEIKYFSIPTLFAYSLNKELSLEAGPCFNFATGVPFKEFKKFELSANLGMKYLKGRIGLEVRYDYGLSKLIQTSYTDAITLQVHTDNVSTSKALVISFLYLFSKKDK